MSWLRVPFMLVAVINLIAGMWAGLIRLGWELPVAVIAVHHGAIMVGGFLTTLIALEKAIPLKRNVAYLPLRQSELSCLNFCRYLLMQNTGSLAPYFFSCRYRASLSWYW